MRPLQIRTDNSRTATPTARDAGNKSWYAVWNTTTTLLVTMSKIWYHTELQSGCGRHVQAKIPLTVP